MYDTREKSRFEGAPVEYFEFTFGVTAWRLTSGDLTHEPWEGAGVYTRAEISRSEQRFTKEDDQASIEVRLPATHEVAQLFTVWNPPGAVTLRIYRMHRGDTEHTQIHEGAIVAIQFEGAEVALTSAPDGGPFTRQVPANSYQTQCNWAFCDSNCRKDITDVTFLATITSVDGVTLTADAFADHADGYFRSGWVRLANGEGRTIVDHVGNTVTLIAPFAGLDVGTEVEAIAGCDHTEAACRVHDNIVNHLGFPRIPSRNPFTAGV